MKRLFAFASALIGGLLVATTTPNVALADDVLEPPGLHQGYYASLGLYGLSNINWEKGDQLNGAWFGSGQAVRFGQMLTRKLGLGLALNFGGTAGEANGRKQTSSLFALSLEGQWMPFDRFSILAGSGVGAVQYKYNKVLPDEPTDLRGGAGGIFSLGASYDFFPYRKPLSGGLALSPTVRMQYLPGGTANMFAVFFGLDITWWTGLPKNQLDLPPDRAF
jgi:hypothetical protein